MPLFFFFNNLHFAFEIFGALAFLVVAWLAFDALWIRKDFLTISRGVGFLLLSVSQVVHAFILDTSALGGYLGTVFYLLGLTLVLLNLILEMPSPRPEFKIVLVLPPLAAILPYVHATAALIQGVITFLALRQFRVELKVALRPFWLGFLFLTLSSAAVALSKGDSFDWLWVLGHISSSIGFGLLLWWAWQYLQLRIREELTIIFVSMALFISIIVTLAFSFILVRQIEQELTENLLTNSRVFEFGVLRLREEALAKAMLLSKEAALIDAVLRNNFVELERLSTILLEREKLGFFTLTDGRGEVILRAHALTQRGDNLSGEDSVGSALQGKALVTIESSPAEGFSLRASAPLLIKEKAKGKSQGSRDRIIGTVVVGFPLDNVLADSIKRLTGLEFMIFEGQTVVASTLLEPNRRSRVANIVEANEKVKRVVLEKGETLTLQTRILSRPFLASYLPLRDNKDTIVGMIASLKPQQEVLDLANATNRLTLLTVMILILLLSLPIYIVTRRLSREVV